MIVRSVFSSVTALAALTFAAPVYAQESDKTLAEYEAECDAGTLASCHEAGRAYMLGDEHPADVEADDARAIALFTKACDADYGDSCNHLARMGERAAEDSPLRAQVIPLFTKGCELESSGACNNLAIRYFEGRGVEKDAARASKLFGDACGAGEARSCYNAAVLRRTGDAGFVDLPGAALYLEIGCNRDFAPACTDLGVVFLNGDGMPKDTVAAVRNFTKACDLSSAKGCYNLGVMYDEGTGTERNMPMALKSFSRACEAGDEDGCTVVQGTKDNCTGIYNEFAVEGEFDEESRKVLRFYANIADEGRELFESGKLGMNVRLNEYVSGPTDFDPGERVDDVDEGTAQIILWPGQPPYYMEASEELTNTEDALAFVDHMCGLVEHGVIVDKIYSSIFTTIYTGTIEE